jgi:hypothetical protein
VSPGCLHSLRACMETGLAIPSDRIISPSFKLYMWYEYYIYG